MSINRQALLAHCLFHPRYGGQPTAEERAAFERVALNESQPLTRWLEVGDGKSVAAADILEMRGQLKSFHDATLQRARASSMTTFVPARHPPQWALRVKT